MKSSMPCIFRCAARSKEPTTSRLGMLTMHIKFVNMAL